MSIFEVVWKGVVLFLLASCQLPTGMTGTTESPGESATSNPATTSEGESASSTSAPTSSTTSEGTSTTGPTSSSTATTTAGDEVSTTTGAPDPEWDASCAAWCTRAVECLGPPDFRDFDSCMRMCVPDPPDSPACVEATIAFRHCVAGLSCAELVTGDYTPCSEELLAASEVCACTTSWGGCSLKRWCPGHPTIAIECDESSCTCTSDHEVIGTCPAADFCDLDLPGQEAFAEACCGLVFSPSPDI
ncbi:hypothetical protein [Nannocystis punicea]|uniref:Uncharacterized protein n=1 Tax=Nannocystis punicea TaxID=2995304 RepID=A0ABY7H0B6_9BACT|nr:hypothetical protein [Nannocystis poenicansa]WAS92691.1 hypothetical protein O0S08_41455 [Nannocystis poenicansa]